MMPQTHAKLCLAAVVTLPSLQGAASVWSNVQRPNRAGGASAQAQSAAWLGQCDASSCNRQSLLRAYGRLNSTIKG